MLTSRRTTHVARDRTLCLGVFDSAQPQLCRYRYSLLRRCFRMRWSVPSLKLIFAARRIASLWHVLATSLSCVTALGIQVRLRTAQKDGLEGSSSPTAVNQ